MRRAIGVRYLSCLLLCSVLAPSLPALAYNPPVDTAGPLRVRIVGPEEVTQTGVAVPVRVVLENRGEEAVQGTLQLGVIDRWTVEPGGPVRFEVEGSGTAGYDFKVTAGEGTYSAHYPIHAYARFTHGGKELVAHPILLLETKLPRPPRARLPIRWQPLEVPADGEIALWRTPVRRAVFQVFGEEPKTMPVGWEGSDERTGASMGVRRETLAGDSREVVAIHPPWRDGLVGTLAVEFPLRLPDVKPIKLRFAQGMTPTGQSDGVTFRVRVLPLDDPEGRFGEVVYEKHTATKTWQQAEADLSAFAGKAIRLQLESHPGPKNNTGWDQSYWAEPTLVAGTPPFAVPFPPEDKTGSRLVGKTACAGRQYEVRVWPGRRGLLDAAVGFSSGDKRLLFHGFEVRVLGGRIDDARSPILLQCVSEEPCDDGLQVRHRFQSRFGSFDVVGRTWIDRGTLRVAFRLENAPAPQPWLAFYLEEVAAGPWSEKVQQVYAGHGNVVRDPGPFRLGFDGHRLSTSFVGFDFEGGLSLVQAVDTPPISLEVQPDQRHYSLHGEHDLTFTFIPAGNVFEAVKVFRQTNDLKPGGGVKAAAGRFVFDLWGGRYGESADALKRSFRYGLTDAMVIWHNWQRWGYDYRLPEIYPPNPRYGTLEEMKRLIATCREAGVPIALHDNYIDFYPDAEGFSYETNIAFHRDGTPVKAWLNEGRDAQSYRYRADRIEPYLKPNLNTIQKDLGPTAYFIDVWSSIRPYDYWTADGRLQTAVDTRDTWAGLFDWIRELQGGRAPQISESGHDQLVGHLDGAQTNHLRVGPPVGEGRHRWAVWDWKCGDAERTPWFDVAHHDRFILHGAGYSSRYQAGLDARLHGIFSDDYIATEVLTGHPAMVPGPFGRDVVRKYWLTAETARALALRQIEAVEYAGGNLHRQHVRWSGGGEVWVNRGETDWDVAGATLPQYGFLAKVPTDDGLVEASIQRRDGVIVEMARSPQHLYVNGRQIVDGPLPIRVSVDKVQWQGDGRAAMSLTWQADAPIPASWTPFLHFCDGEGEIVFQAHHNPGRFDDQRRGEISATAAFQLPGDAKPDQAFELRAGIYNQRTGQRLSLAGADDGTRRIRLGTLRLEGDGDRITGVAWQAMPPEPDPLLARFNAAGKPVDFGPVKTAGACRLSRDGNDLTVTPLPETPDGGFTLEIAWNQLPWTLARPANVVPLDDQGKPVERQSVSETDGTVRLVLRGGVFCFRVGR